MSRWTRRLLWAALAGLILFYLIYLVGANLYLRSGRLQQAVSHQPEHFQLKYESAWTAWPGAVRLHGLELRGQARTVQWWLHLDEATIGVDLARLLRKDLTVNGLAGTGAAFRLRRRPPTVQPAAAPGAPASSPAPPPASPPPPPPTAAEVAGLPEIPGLANTPAPPPTPEKPSAGRHDWSFHLSAVELDRVREIWIQTYRFAGDARASGGFDLQDDHHLVLDPGSVDFHAGSLALAARPLLSAFKGRVSLTFPAFDPDAEGGGFFRLASGGVRLHGEIAGLGFLDPYLEKVHWIRLVGSPGSVDADIRLARGTYAAGTRVTARPGRVTAWFLDDEAWGDALLTAAVDADHGSPLGRLVVAFDEYQLGRKGASRARGHGRGLRIEVDARAPALTTLPAPTALAFDLPPAEIGDFASYNQYLPRGSGIVLRGGRGQLTANLRAAAPSWEGSGAVALRGRGIEADVQGSRLRGNLDAHSRFRAQVQGRQVALEESDVRLYDVVSLAAPAATTARTPGTADAAGARGGTPGTLAAPATWWAKAHLDYATVRPDAAVPVQARVRGQLSDLRPLLTLFAPTRRRLLSWVDSLLDLRPVNATGELAMGKGSLALDGVRVVAGKAEVLARLRFAGVQRDGVLYASYGVLGVGMELRHGQRSWKLVHARQWFDSQNGGAAPAAKR